MEAAGYRGGDPGEGCIEGVSIDTRTGCAGALFVALKGTHADGHDFIAEAVERGAAALLVSRYKMAEVESLTGSVPVFDVPDTLAALQAAASRYRTRVSPKVVAVTGSSGKTETKNLIASILSKRFRVHATPGNMNNHIGLPLTLLGMEGSEDVLITEMGANHKREIAHLSGIASPEIGVITNVGPSHLEFFGTLGGVAAAKAELIEALPPDGTAVLPADDPFFEFLKGRTKAKVVSFGITDGADWRVEHVEKRDEGGYRFTLGGQDMVLGLYGRHHLLNAAAATAVASLLDVSIGEIAAVIAEAKPVDKRGVLYSLDGIIIMDDSYNSNPASLAAAVDAFMEINIHGRCWLVLGDMLELGEQSEELHSGAGITCGRAGVDGIFTLGEKTVELSRTAAVQRKAPPHITHFIDADNLAAHLNTLLEPGDGVLIKGSRGMQMERVIEALEGIRGVEKRRVE